MMGDVNNVVCLHKHIFSQRYFRLWSVSLDGGNSTVLDMWGYTVYQISKIAVLHEDCGNSGMNSNRIPYSAWKTSGMYVDCQDNMLNIYFVLSFIMLTMDIMRIVCGSFF